MHGVGYPRSVHFGLDLNFDMVDDTVNGGTRLADSNDNFLNFWKSFQHFIGDRISESLDQKILLPHDGFFHHSVDFFVIDCPM